MWLPTASEGWGKVMFSVCPHREEGEGYPKVPPPPHSQVRTGGVPQGTYPPAKVPTPQPGQDGGGYPKVPTPQPNQDGAYSKVPTPLAKVPNPPPPPPRIGQHMEYLIRCGRYASYVHAGGLSCLSKHYIMARHQHSFCQDVIFIYLFSFMLSAKRFYNINTGSYLIVHEPEKSTFKKRSSHHTEINR